MLAERPYPHREFGGPGLDSRHQPPRRRRGIELGVAVADMFEDAFGRVFDGAVESDGFNRLVLAARLSADQITVLRAYAKYLRQTALPCRRHSSSRRSP